MKNKGLTRVIEIRDVKRGIKSCGIKSLIILLMSLTHTGVIQAEGDAVHGKSLVSACVVCHGEDGNSRAGAFPSIAGQGEKYLLKQMQDIQSGARSAPLMAGQLNSFSEKDLKDIAEFYGSQAPVIGAASKDLVELGETIYRAGIARKKIAACSGCHAPNGAGNEPAAFPALRGQWPAYTVAQLKAFRTGQRTNDGDGHMMKGIALDMSDREIEAVASYIYGLSD